MTDYFQAPDNELYFKAPQTPRSARHYLPYEDFLPHIDTTEGFSAVVATFVEYIHHAIDAAYSYEQLQTTFAGQSLRPLVLRLCNDCHHPAVVAALLAAKQVFRATDDEGTGLSESRGLACEIVAWQFLTCLSENEIMDYVLYEVHDLSTKAPTRKISTSVKVPRSQPDDSLGEDSPLIRPQPRRQPNEHGSGTSYHTQGPASATTTGFPEEQNTDHAANHMVNDTVNDSTLRSLAGMNALEIAGIVGAKRFISQKTVQKIVDDIWSGDVMFWESLNVDAVRRPRAYNEKVADPFTRLRVPRYQKAFQVVFFISFLVLFYGVLLGPVTQQVTLTEALLYWWIAAFAYDELGDIQDTGTLYYKVDFWSLWDVAIIGVCVIFVAMRIYGKVKDEAYITNMAFDCLSLVALFLVPRIFSVVSLNAYFGSMIPVLKEMTKSMCMFLPVILVLFTGFLTSFSMLSRDEMSFKQISWTLVEVFFGATQIGLDTSVKISPHFGYPLMLVYVCLTNIVLFTSLVSLVSNSLSEVMAHARTEYLFQYSIYVLESSSSRRLTYFMPPLNLIPLLLLRPLRLLLPSEHVRRIRIVLLKATHVGFLAFIWVYEASIRLVTRGNIISTTTTRRGQSASPSLSAGLQIDRDRYARRPWPSSTSSKAKPHQGPSDSASVVADADVVKLIQKLSAQVDQLTAIIARQQRG